MTASRHKFMNDFLKQTAALLRPFGSMVCVWLLITAGAVAQETEQTEPTQVDIAEEQQAGGQQEAPAPTPGAEPAKKNNERYYLGERLKLKRQQGPAIGKATSILPQPFVPKGSVVVPPAPIVNSELLTRELGAESGDALVAVGALIEGPDTLSVLGVGDGDTANARVAGTLFGDQTVNAVEENTNTATNTTSNSASQFLEAASLDLLDPSGLSVISAYRGFAADFWQGYARNDVVKSYGRFANTAGSPALAQIADKIALSGANLPEPANDEEILSVIAARLQLLKDLGNHKGYVALLDRLPIERDWSPLAKHFTNRHLLQGEIGDACLLATRELETDSDPYWLRLSAFCEAAHGNRNGVDFQLGILEEVADVKPTFYQLIDQIIVEAEQAPGTIVPAAATLSNSLKIDLLEVTMARLARAKIPLVALDSVNPLAVRMMLALPGLERAAKVDVLGLAQRNGWIDGAGITAFARNYTLQDNEQETALMALADDHRFVIDAALTSLVSSSDVGEVRTQALISLWKRAIDQRTATVTATGMTALTSDMVPSPDGGEAIAVLTRAALLGGDKERAASWFRVLRSQAAGDVLLDKALVALLPLVTVAGTPVIPELTDATLAYWWQGQAEAENRFAQANLLYTILESLGHTVAEDSWQKLEDGPAVFSGSIPSVALWRRFMIAVGENDVPLVLMQAFALLADNGPSGVPATLAGSLVNGLMSVGLEDEARMIATEILISQGL